VHYYRNREKVLFMASTYNLYLLAILVTIYK